MWDACIRGRESVSWGVFGSEAAALPAQESVPVTRATCPQEEAGESGALTSTVDADALPTDLHERIRIAPNFPVKRAYRTVGCRFPAVHCGHGANRRVISTHTIACMSTFIVPPHPI